jgi:hypothetical protein
MSFIHITSVTSDVVSAPKARAPFWPQSAILGGGFRVNWGGAGSLATSSTYDIGPGFPNASTDCWTARSKDHNVPSPASITAYTVSIVDPILHPRFGYSVKGMNNLAQSSVASQHQSCNAKLQSGFVMTGGGSEVIFSGAGNYLWRLEPIIDNEGNQSFFGASKDHQTPDPATMVTRVFGIDLLRIVF